MCVWKVVSACMSGCAEVRVRGKGARSLHILVHMGPSTVGMEMYECARTVQYAHAEVFTAE